MISSADYAKLSLFGIYEPKMASNKMGSGLQELDPPVSDPEA